MDYKSYMGYGKKKTKKTKKVEKTLPKKNSIIENVQNEIKDYPLEQVLNEVGMAPDIKKHTMKINKLYDAYWDAVKDLQKFLKRKGASKVSKEMGSLYVTNVGKFHNWLKTKFIRMIRKMI